MWALPSVKMDRCRKLRNIFVTDLVDIDLALGIELLTALAHVVLLVLP
jgi:hypothetical protein